MKTFFKVLIISFCFLSLQRPFGSPAEGILFSRDVLGDVDLSQAMIEPGEFLSFREATQIGLAQALGIQIARLDQEIQFEEIGKSKSIYDTKLDLTANYLLNEEQQPSVVFGNRVITGSVGAGVEKMLSSGTTLRVEAEMVRNSTNSTFSSLSRNYESLLKFSVSQPLLRNFFGFIDRAQIKQVQLNTQKFDYETLRLIEEQISEIRMTYLDLVLTHEVYLTRTQALDKAREFYDITLENEDLGLAEKPDAIASKANLKRRLIEALEAKTRLEQKSAELQILMNTWNVDLIFPEKKEGDLPPYENYDEALASALAQRWDLKQLDLDLENQEIEVKIKKNKFLPDLNVFASYGSTSLDRDHKNSAGEVFGFNHPQYEVGASLNTALEKRFEKAELSQEQIKLSRLRMQKEQIKRGIQRDVFIVLKDLEYLEGAVRENQDILNLQNSKLEEEEKQFNSGRSTSKTIIDFQQDVIDAKLAWVESRIQYLKAYERLQAVKSNTFQSAGLQHS